MRIASGLLGLTLCACMVHAADIQIVNGDGPGEGFNDPTPVAPLPGNPGATLGAQRLAVFEAAAAFWETLLVSPVPIRVNARFDPLGCSAFSATLGSAGPNTVHRDFAGAPRSATWFTQAQANALTGRDLSGAPDIDTRFNGAIDFNDGCLSGTDWWYGLGEAAPAGSIDLYSTVLHELAHGLGFLDLVNSGTGGKFGGLDDIYMVFLEDHSLGLAWPAMTDAQRLASITDTGDLHWIGPLAVAASGALSGGVAQGHPRIYAPDPARGGSSVAHWDTTLAPNELMEPFSTRTFITGLTQAAFEDMGWPFDERPLGIHDSYTLQEDDLLSVDPGAGVLGNDLARGSGLSASLVQAPTSGGLALARGGSFSYDPDTNFSGVDTFTYRPAAGSNPTTVTLFVTAVNDAPEAVDDPDFTVDQGTTLVVPAPGVLANDEDVDGDALTAILADDVARGTLELRSDGGFSYTPASGDCETASFTYRASDSEATSGLATVAVAITGCSVAIEVTAEVAPTAVEEPGGPVSVTVAVANVSTQPGSVTLASLSESVTGDLDGRGDCALPQEIAAGARFECTYGIDVSGEAGTSATRTLAAGGTHEGGDTVDSEAAFAVAVEDVLPAAGVSLSASPGAVDEGGGEVTLEVAVTHEGTAEPLTLTALVDGDGSLQGQGTCTLPRSLPVGASYACTYPLAVPARGVGTFDRTVTATLSDDDGNAITPSATASVAVTDAPPSATLGAVATPDVLTEAGGAVEFALVLANTGAERLTLTSLSDEIDGNLAGRGTCSLPQVVSAGESYGCAYPATAPPGQPGPADRLLSAAFADDDGNTATAQGSAALTLDDAAPTATLTVSQAPAAIAEPGAPFTVSVTVENTSAADTITLGQLTDSRVGDLAGVGTCTLPQTLAPAGSYGCTFGREPAVQAGTLTRTVTVLFEDEEASSASAQGESSVTVDDLAPALALSVTATPATVGASGGPVTFTARVDNTSPGDAVTLTTLVDGVLGDLAGVGDCLLPQVVPIGARYTCTWVDELAGAAGTSTTRTVVAAGTDEEANAAGAEAAVEIAFSDDAPLFSVARAVTSDPVPEPGGPVAFSITVTSLETERALTLTTLVDSVDGDLDGRGSCALPQPLAPGASYACVYGIDVVGASAAVPRTSTTTATVRTGGGIEGTGAGSATAAFLDVPPQATATYEPEPATPAAPGEPVRFTVTVRNPGAAEPVTLSALADDVLGDLSLRGDCQLPVVIGPEGRFRCAYTVILAGEAGESTTRRLSAGVTDDEGNAVVAEASATLTFGAAPVENRAPVAADDRVTGPEDTTLALEPPGLLGNDADPDGDPLFVLDATAPGAGTLTVSPDGSLLFDPPADLAGEFTFSYRATDGRAASAPATVTLVITPVNDPPVVGDDAFRLPGDGELVVPAPGVLANDSDRDGELTARLASPPGQGVVALDPDGGFRFVPAAGFLGRDAFTYLATDGELEEEATVTITAEAVFADGFEAP